MHFSFLHTPYLSFSPQTPDFVHSGKLIFGNGSTHKLQRTSLRKFTYPSIVSVPLCTSSLLKTLLSNTFTNSVISQDEKPSFTLINKNKNTQILRILNFEILDNKRTVIRIPN